MKTRPKTLTFLALFLAIIAISVPLQIILLYGDSPFDLSSILAKLSPLNWAVISAALLCSYLAYRGSPWLRVGCPAFLILVLWNNWLVAVTGLNSSTLLCGLAALAVVSAHGVLLEKGTLSVLKNPAQRWWLTPPRKEIILSADVLPVSGGDLSVKTFDISESGAFFTFSKTTADLDRLIQVNSYATLRLNLSDYYSLNCAVRIVRKTGGQGRYPAGFAVKFLCLTHSQRRYLARRLGIRPVLSLVA